ncbi:MAG TPA: tetratricopeptide repeat protein, partial [Ktedonobacteraceae bacterium]|nr:tetratricopeptide repeat protein [Ktedonobacteraceae bacterium]
MSITNGTQAQMREEAYWRAWSHAQDGQWDQAGQVLFSPEVSGETFPDLRVLGRTERRRKIYYTLAMGDVAVRLAHYEQAMFHYTQCITFLDERRMNNANLRVRALLGLGLTHLLTGYSVSALNYYTEALRVSGKDSCSEYVPDIYYGLCEISRHQPNDERALDYGKKALRLYIERGNKVLECQMRNILGRIYYQMGDFESSNACYTESLALAINVG